jgi:hypothetical protein
VLKLKKNNSGAKRLTGWTTEAPWFRHQQGNGLFYFTKKLDRLLDVASSYAIQTGSAG